MSYTHFTSGLFPDFLELGAIETLFTVTASVSTLNASLSTINKTSVSTTVIKDAKNITNNIALMLGTINCINNQAAQYFTLDNINTISGQIDLLSSWANTLDVTTYEVPLYSNLRSNISISAPDVLVKLNTLNTNLITAANNGVGLISTVASAKATNIAASKTAFNTQMLTTVASLTAYKNSFSTLTYYVSTAVEPAYKLACQID